MAGIGFSLRKLFDKKGVLNLCRAYGYAGVITIGPMLLGLLLIASMGILGKIGGMSEFDLKLQNSMLTYTILCALMVTCFFNMGVTRYVSDMLYEDKEDKVMPSFFGSSAIMLVICTVGYGIFLYFSGATFVQGVLCLWLADILVIVWNETIYLTALKDYKAIFLTFLIGVIAGLVAAVLVIYFKKQSIEMMIISVIIAYGVLAVGYFRHMMTYFPKSSGSAFYFLKWFARYRSLVLAGGLIAIGLYGHLILMYFSPVREQVLGLFYGAPLYELPALLAFISCLFTTINFVTSVEVRFYPKYSTYYGLFNERGSIEDITLAEREMRTVMIREMVFASEKQMFITVLFIVFLPQILKLLPLGLNQISISIFRFLCVGYGTYALANTSFLLLLYFEDYKDALISAILFAVGSLAASWAQTIYLSVEYYGIGFFIGAIIFYFYATIRLNFYTKKLPYYLLAKSSILPVSEKSLFARMADALENKKNAKEQAEA